MEFVFDLFRERILTALRSAKASPKGGFLPAAGKNLETAQRVLKHLGLAEFPGSPLAFLAETGLFGSLRFACLVTDTHLCFTGAAIPLKLADITDADCMIVGTRMFPTVTAGPRRYTLRCSADHAVCLKTALQELCRALRLTQNAALVFDSAIAAHEGAPLLLPKEPPALTEFSVEPPWLFPQARRLLTGGDTARGTELLLLAADLGGADAQYALGLFFRLNGSPAQKDGESAAYWFAQAAAQGHSAAQEQLELHYTAAAQEDGAALWVSRRRSDALLRLAQGDEADRQKAEAVCMERARRGLAAALTLMDPCIFPHGGSPLERSLAALEALKESCAWAELAKKAGAPEAADHPKSVLSNCRSLIVNEIIPALKQASRTQDAHDCTVWLAELGDSYTQAALGRQALEQQDPIRGIRWLERALESGGVHGPMYCAELGAAYAAGKTVPPEPWAELLPHTPRNQAIGFYLLERSGNPAARERYRPTDARSLQTIAEELTKLAADLPRAAQLAEQYRAMAENAAKNA